jgi:hypothetical protein
VSCEVSMQLTPAACHHPYPSARAGFPMPRADSSPLVGMRCASTHSGAPSSATYVSP